MNREAIFSALFDRLSGVAEFTTKSRRLKHWNDVSPSEQPAMFQAQGDQSAAPGDPARGLPTKWTLNVDIYIYVQCGDDEAPATVINPILDAVEAILKPDYPDVQRTQTLGGLVEHCWIEGQIDTDEGTLGNQAVAVIPIRILVA